MLLILILIPFIGAFHIILSNNLRAKILSLKYTLFTIMFSCIILLIFNPIDSYQMNYYLIYSNIYNIGLSIDGLSIIFVLLTTITIPLCILASWNIEYISKRYFVILLLFEAFTLLVWLASDLFLFYIGFEIVLVPLFLIIGIFSKNQNKIRAAFLLFIYTFTGSLFILWSFITIYYNTGTSSIEILMNIDINDKYIWLGIFISLAIKTPIIPFHNWILRAHVEAPVAGSIVLAGLTLKIASYAILRILIGIIPTISLEIAPLVNTIAIISIVYASLAALRQTDIKCFVAYTSVAHIGVVVTGIFSGTFTGILGSIILSIAHGITSPALFFIVGGIIYDRYHTRIIKYYRGITQYIPLTILILFIFSLANIGVPITANWIGELYCLSGSFILNPYISIIATSTVFLSSCYTIWLYNRVAFGSYTPHIDNPTDMNRREFYIILTLIIFLIILGCSGFFITNITFISLIHLIP